MLRVVGAILLLVLGVQPSPLGGSSDRKNSHINNDDDSVFLNQWAVHILGGPLVADQVANDIGFENLGQVSEVVYSALQTA